MQTAICGHCQAIIALPPPANKARCPYCRGVVELSPASKPGASAPAGWACRACTLVNDASARTCAACDSPLPVVAPVSSLTKIPPDRPSAQPSWACRSCSRVNSSEAALCCVCRATRPDTAPQVACSPAPAVVAPPTGTSGARGGVVGGPAHLRTAADAPPGPRSSSAKPSEQRGSTKPPAPSRAGVVGRSVVPPDPSADRADGSPRVASPARLGGSASSSGAGVPKAPTVAVSAPRGETGGAARVPGGAASSAAGRGAPKPAQHAYAAPRGGGGGGGRGVRVSAPLEAPTIGGKPLFSGLRENAALAEMLAEVERTVLTSARPVTWEDVVGLGACAPPL